jgi:serine/threonine protein kinase
MSASIPCPACGEPVEDDSTTCGVCGWTDRTHQSGVGGETSLWEDDEELADRVEVATGGEYEIQGLIGRGGMATVYLGREVALDRSVAIKVLAPHLMRSSGMAERFKREARVAAGLSHRNIIPIHAVKESGPLICLVMKRLTGRSLDALIDRRNPLPLAVVQIIINDVAAGLDFAHQHGIVHRDVKPANILVDSTGEVVVTDFGIAKAREADSLTASGSTIGTPAYMSPEQAMGKRATGASDQYALGAVAYELLTGRMPFIADTAMGLMYQHTHTPAEPVTTLRPDIPEGVSDAILRMLAKDPAERFPTLAEAAQAFGLPEGFGSIGDPTRAEIARLIGTASTPIPRRASPGSRSLSGKRSPGLTSTADPNKTTMQIALRGRDRRIAIWSVAGLLTVAAMTIYAWRLGSQRGVVPPVAPPRPADSASAPAATPGTTPTVPIDSAATQRQTSRPARATTPAPAPAATRPTIQGAIERYRRAIESRDAAQVVSAYPAIGPTQLGEYRQLFDSSTVIRFEVIIKDLNEEGGEARMRLEGFLRARDRTSGVDRIIEYRRRARLVDGPTGWRIVEIR